MRRGNGGGRGLLVIAITFAVVAGGLLYGGSHGAGAATGVGPNSGRGVVGHPIPATLPLAPSPRVGGSGPGSSVQTSGSGTPYVADTLVVFNNTLIPGNFLASNSTGVSPQGVAYDSGKGEVFVTAGTRSVYVVSDTTNRIVNTLTVGSNARGVAYDSGKGEIFVTNYYSNNVSVISDATNTVVATVSVGVSPIDVAYDSGKGELFVANYYSSNVSVISDATNTVVASIPVGAYPDTVSYGIGRGEVFVANDFSKNVSVISDATNAVVATVAVGSFCRGTVYDAGVGELFYANGGPRVSVISAATNAVVATIPVGSYPDGMAYDSANGEVFVANEGSNNVSVISDATNTIVATVAGGNSPFDAAYDSGNGDVYVTNSGGGTLSILSPDSAYAVTFTENGLPSGTRWSVTLGGTLVSSNTTTIAFVVPNGTQPFVVGPVSGYVAVPATGSVPVSGSPVNLTIDFTPPPPSTYAVTFAESGLPSGTLWSVIVNGSTQNSTTTQITYTETNSTYAFAVGAIVGYTANPASGSLTVNGLPVTQNITFSAIPPGSYSVTFTESGLPIGTTWYVNITGGPSTASTGNTTIITEPNGTYDYTVATSDKEYVPVPTNGSFGVSGVSVSESVAFNLVTYTVTFTETGLPNGTNWSVTLGGTQVTSTTSSLAFKEANGSHSYSVGSVSGYVSSPSSGTVTVNGTTPSPVSVSFSPASTVPPSSPPTSGLSLLDYVIIGIVILLVAIAAVVALTRRRRRAPPQPFTIPSQPGPGAPPSPP